MRSRQRWPAELLLVRHAESIGNVARDLAESTNAATIDIAERDMDVPVSERGAQQARAVGDWLCGLGRRQPTVVLASPYARAAGTAELALSRTGSDVPVVLDERLREREFGILDRLTRRGIEERFPEEAAARARLGKFYYRPPGGESWCDVALRVRSVLDSITREHEDERVLVVTHEVVIFVFRYVLERLTEQDLLTIAAQHVLANASVTRYVKTRDPATGMALEGYNDIAPLQDTGAPITAEPDVRSAPR
jgi:broad specificity phosphatase PhoE